MDEKIEKWGRRRTFRSDPTERHPNSSGERDVESTANYDALVAFLEAVDPSTDTLGNSSTTVFTESLINSPTEMTAKRVKLARHSNGQQLGQIHQGSERSLSREGNVEDNSKDELGG